MILICVLCVVVAIIWLLNYRVTLYDRRLKEEQDMLAEEVAKLREVDLEIEELWEDEE